MLKRILCIALTAIMCLPAFGVYADEDTPIYEIIDVYVANEKHTGYDDIRFADEGISFTDLSEAESHEIRILSALGICSTDKEAFCPDDAMTRAELVAMAAKLIKARKYAQSGNVLFSDVPADCTHYGEISAMAELGIISGYSNGTFRPDNAISYDEAVSVVMKALGYRVAAELKGGWSAGYRTVAKQIGLTDGIAMADSGELSRYDAVQLIYNALECPIFVPITFGANIRYEADENRTPLSEYHDIYKEEGYVNATMVSALSGYKPTNATHITVGENDYLVNRNEYVEYLGYYVEMYYKNDGKNEKEIVYLAPDDKLEKLVIKADDISKFSDLTYQYGESNKKATVAKNHNLIVNGVRISDYDDSAFIPENGDVVLVSSKGGSYDTVIVNTFSNILFKSLETDRDERLVFESQYSIPSFVIDYEDNEKQAFVMYLNGKKIDFFYEHQDIYNGDGIKMNQIVVPELPANSVFNIFADKYKTVNGYKLPADDAKFVKIDITTKYINGKAGARMGDKLRIENEGTAAEYRISPKNVMSLNKLDYKLGMEGYFLFDYDGRVYAYTAGLEGEQYVMDETGAKVLVGEENLTVGLVYGYLIRTVDEDVFEGNLKARILDMDGRINMYTFDDKVEINGVMVSGKAAIKAKLNESAKLLDPTFEISQLIKYQINRNNIIKKIQTVQQSVGLPGGVDKTSLRREHERANFRSRYEYGWIAWLTEGKQADVPLFNGEARQYFRVPDKETFRDEDYTVPASWWPNNSTKLVDIYDCDDVLVPNVIVEYENNTDNEYYHPYVMVKNTGEAIDEDGNTVDYLHFVGLAGDPVLNNAYTFNERSRYPGEEEETDGGEAIFYAETDGLFDGLKPGDLIKIYGKNRKIDKWEMVLSLEEAKAFDLSKFPERAESVHQKWDMYEVYSVKEASTRVLMVQRGKPTIDGKREYMQLNPFSGTEGVILYDASGREPEIRYWDNPHILDQARLTGVGEASRVYIWESNVVMKLLVGYIGL